MALTQVTSSKLLTNTPAPILEVPILDGQDNYGDLEIAILKITR